MTSHSLFVLAAAAACAVCGQITLADLMKNETKIAKSKDTEKTKRDVNIIGPIPTRYRGQATGQTTFDGISAGELQLPANDLAQSRSTSAPRSGQFRARSAIGTAGFGTFQAESRPDVYNFDGKEEVTYDGVLASDLMVPYAHSTVLNQQARSEQPQYLRQRVPQTTIQHPAFQQFQTQPAQTIQHPAFQQFQTQPVQTVQHPAFQQFQTQPVQTVQHPAFQQFQTQPVQLILRQANFADRYRNYLTLPSSAPNQLQSFHQAGTVSPSTDPSLYQPETPSERYNQLHQQYQATLAEYRKALIRFQGQLQKYSSS